MLNEGEYQAKTVFVFVAQFITRNSNRWRTRIKTCIVIYVYACRIPYGIDLSFIVYLHYGTY